MPGVPQEVLRAFGSVGTPAKMPGGEGRSYRVGHLVFKPVLDPLRYEWVGDILSRIESKRLRVSRPQLSLQGSFTYSGWAASTYEPGEELHGRWADKLQAGRDFHAAVEDLSPTALPPGQDRWTIAHKIAWGETGLPQAVNPATRHNLQRIFNKYQPVEVSNQVVHSDLCGNILFADGLPPLVVDFSPAYRPPEYSEAILVADAIAWENAPLGLRWELPGTPYWDQLLLRAVNFRLIVAALFHLMDIAEFKAEYERFNPLLQLLSGQTGGAPAS